jgi:hypothetical protein
MKNLNIAVGLVLFAALVVGSYRLIGAQRASAQTEETGASPSGFAAMSPDNSERMLKEGQHTFRFDTFGDEAWWGDTLHLHEAIEGAKFGGIGPGISPATALSLGLKVDLDALPESLVQRKRASNPPSQATEPVLKCGYGSSDERSHGKTTDAGRDSADCVGVCNERHATE